MNYLHTRTRRLVVAVLLVGGIGLAPALALSARSANLHGSSSSGNTVSYYHQTKLLGSTTVPSGSGLDVVWADSICSNGYGSPPAAFTWSDASTGVTSAPLIGPCGTAPGAATPKGPDDLRCDFSSVPPFINCYWTWKATSGSATARYRIGNPVSGNIGLGALYVYKRTGLYAYRVTPGKPYQKISVPAGADTIKFAPAG